MNVLLIVIWISNVHIVSPYLRGEVVGGRRTMILSSLGTVSSALRAAQLSKQTFTREHCNSATIAVVMR